MFALRGRVLGTNTGASHGADAAACAIAASVIEIWFYECTWRAAPINTGE